MKAREKAEAAAKEKKIKQIKENANVEKNAEKVAHDRKMKNLDAEIKKVEEF